MTEDQAIAIARRFAEEHDLSIGPLSHAILSTAQDWQKFGVNKGADWSIWFKYNGPPIDEKVVSCPAQDSPTGITVDDTTGEACIVWLL